jgi:twitching motility two-component system response regulator PilG
MLNITRELPTVLVVDDCKITQRLLKKTLENNYRIVVASDAVEALKKIYKEPIDMLILDVSMPEIDGLELCRTLRTLPRFKDTPIIMLTARDGIFDKIKGKIAGATEYLTKPFDGEHLQEILKDFASNLVENNLN